MLDRKAQFSIGQVVRHRFFPFRGVIFDVDPTFNNTEEWWQSIPEEVRPKRINPFTTCWLKTNRRPTRPTYQSKIC